MNCHQYFYSADLNILVQWMMAFDQIPKKDWYSILGANPSASMSDLKQKYQKLILMVSVFFQILNRGGE